MCFDDLLLPLGLDCPRELYGVTVSRITTDSRKVIENSIFICVCGSSDDGHNYVEEAIRRGARVIVAEKVRNECVGGAALLCAENTRRLASLLYNLFYKDPVSKMKFIGVTGTNGKTSVSFELLAILESAGYKVGLVGTLGDFSCGRRAIKRSGNMTTPDPDALYSALAEMADDGVEYVVVEVSSHALAQERVAPITFETAIFTNLSEEHLDYHRDMDDYFSAKQKLFLQSKSAVVNIDDPAGKRLYSFLDGQELLKKSCSRIEGDFCALDARITINGTSYVLIENYDKCNAYSVRLNALGDFQVMNSLEALAAARLCGVDINTAINALSTISAPVGRLEKISEPTDDIEVLVDYAHTPKALEALLQSVRVAAPRPSRLVLVFGCGGDRDKGKRKTMGQIASRLADFTVVSSDNPRSEDPKDIIRDILKGINKEKEFAVIESRRDAILAAITQYARKGDTVILAGKGHEDYEITSEGKRPFDERKIAKEALLARSMKRQERT